MTSNLPSDLCHLLGLRVLPQPTLRGGQEGGGRSAPLLCSGLQDQEQSILPQFCIIKVYSILYTGREQTSSQTGSNFCFHFVSAGASGTTGQRDSVGRDPWAPLVDWRHQMVVLVLYRLIFKPLKVVLTGRKLVPGFSFAAATALAGEGRSHSAQITHPAVW